MPRLAVLRIALKIFIPLALIYASLIVLLYVRQRDMMYFPQLTRTAAADADFVLESDGLQLRGWVINPGRAQAILYFGGNAESVERNRDDFARWFEGSTVYLLPYRGYGANAGTPEERGLYRDALALYDQVHRQQPQARIAVIGRSLGSGVASYVAASRLASRLVLITPFDSMADVAQAHYPWLPVRPLVKDRYDSVAHLARYGAPVLIVRAGRDQVVPAANTRRLIASLPTRPRVLDLPEADHNTVQDFPTYGATLAAFLR
ncbi:alpha/beta hydrolase [Lysobacter tyrosinilyticus]